MELLVYKTQMHCVKVSVIIRFRKTHSEIGILCQFGEVGENLIPYYRRSTAKATGEQLTQKFPKFQTSIWIQIQIEKLAPEPASCT